MSRLTNPWSPARSKKKTFSTRLPTNLPGIAFTAQVRCWYRRDLSEYALPWRTAEAAALAGVYEIAKAETKRFDPEAAFHAEQAAAAGLSDWRPLGDSPVMVKATLTLDLTGEDAVKAERFTESLRAGRLDEALAEDHVEFLRKMVLKNEETARLWWLHCNLAGEAPDTSWTAFTDNIRPLIHIGDENDPVNRLAQALLTMNDYYRENPDRLNSLADLTAFAAKKLGEDDVFKTLAEFRQPTQVAESKANGSTPAT